MSQSLLEQFVKTFVPLFIVMDTLGNLPFVIALSQGMSKSERDKTILVAVITGAAVGLAFLFLGKFILDILDISIGAFAIAGGLILLVLSMRYILTGQILDFLKEEMVAVVPIGTPLMVGPATIATLLLLVNEGFHIYMVLLSFALNIVIAWVVFRMSGFFVGFLGQGGLKAVAKVFALLLSAIAVSMIINGMESAGILNSSVGLP